MPMQGRLLSLEVIVRWLALMACVACSGGDDEAPPVDPVEEGCLQTGTGTPTDAGATPEQAKALAPGLDPHLVGLYPDQVSYVTVTTGAGTLVLMSDTEDVFTSIETDGTPGEIPDAFENPTCGQDIPTVHEVPVSAGTHLIGIGPSYKATVWVLVAEK